MTTTKLEAAIIGYCVGDALGVPVEFKPRDALELLPVTAMTGYGTHQQPPGAWSDDSTMTFCLMESLIARRGIHLSDLANRFVNWLKIGYWTPHGLVFDVGIATQRAIQQYQEEGIAPELAGGTGEYSNGNGSLMRILPLAFYLQNQNLDARIDAVTRVSSVTHRHPVSLIACLIYTEIAIHLNKGLPLKDSIQQAAETAELVYGHHANAHLQRFSRLLNGALPALSREDIQSSGYVVHTLEASLWCLLTSGTYEEAVLKAVNLGEDTDTTGAVTGGLAGIIYGFGGIPLHWSASLARREDILDLCRRFEELLTNI